MSISDAELPSVFRRGTNSEVFYLGTLPVLPEIVPELAPVF